MFSHVSVGVTDIYRAVNFYDRVMRALGYDRLFGDEKEGFMAYGPEDSFFIINAPLDESRGRASACNGSHICLKATSKDHVDVFYQTALAAGAADAGPPGIREHYAEDYYAAFVYDLDGHKIEAMAKVSLK